ncbi:MAG: hypothetical protein ACK4KT_01445 [Thermaurantimonas sp.]
MKKTHQLTLHIARVLSYVFHPAVVPLLFVGMFLWLHPNTFDRVQKIYIMMSVVAGTYFLPVTASLLLYRFGVIRTLEMADKEDRKTPYIVAAVFYYFTAVALRVVPSAQLLHMFLMGTSIVILLLLAQIPFYKASAHVASFSGLMAAVMVMSRMNAWSPTLLIAAILAVGLIAWARLELGAHTSREVVAGFFTGFTPIFVLFYTVSQG